MKIVFIDVEQGDSSLVMLSDGTAVLVDCNFYEDKDFQKIKGYLSENELDQGVIDVLIITHPHEDHIRGIGKLSEQFEIKAVYESGHRLFVSDDKKSKHYLDMISVIEKVKRNKGEHKKLTAHSKHKIGSGTLKVFSPTRMYLDSEKPTERDIHDQCLVVKIEEFGRSVLFTGDSSMEAWRDEIIPKYSDQNGKTNLLESTVLHASHHGSNTFFFSNSSGEGEPYLNGVASVSPTISIVSAGVQNRHGHPDQKALGYYKKHSKSDGHVYQTKHQGAIFLSVDANGDYSIFTEDFKKRESHGGIGDAKVSISATPSPPYGGYGKGVQIEFKADYRNIPNGHQVHSIVWTVQNNSKGDDEHHDLYIGQESSSLKYKNSTAYTGEHTLLCEVKNKNGKNICTETMVVNVR